MFIFILTAMSSYEDFGHQPPSRAFSVSSVVSALSNESVKFQRENESRSESAPIWPILNNQKVHIFPNLI